VFHVGLVTEVRPAEGMLVVQRFVDESFILCSTFETDDFSIIPDHKMNMLIETNIIIVISISSVAGLTFVLSDGSRTLLVPCDGRLRDVYLVYSSFNSNTKVVFHGSHFFHPFPSQAFPNLLTDCMPSCVFNEVNMLRQEVFWMMMTCTINQQDVMWGKLNFSVLSWGYITSLCRGLGIVPSKKKLVSAALSLDEYFFLIHRKKRGAS